MYYFKTWLNMLKDFIDSELPKPVPTLIYVKSLFEGTTCFGKIIATIFSMVVLIISSVVILISPLAIITLSLFYWILVPFHFIFTNTPKSVGKYFKLYKED
ncbi:hypothetical protein KUA24_135 [Vibrio phage HNL01]|nr:hypothetical protein KUA24_135 [Vibrio phage HNL01]